MDKRLRFALLIPLVIAIFMLISIKINDSIPFSENLSPPESKPILTALIIFTLGYIFFLGMIFSEDILNLFNKRRSI